MHINYLSFIKHKSFGLLGIGRSTLSTYNFLKEHNFNVYIWDDDENVRNKYRASLNIVNFKYWDFSQLDGIVVSPGIALFYPQEHPILKYTKKCNLPLLNDIELFYYFFPHHMYIGVTGSNGKSSLVTLLNQLFKLAKKNVYLAGNIGVPIFSFKNLPKNSYIILELSSFQLSFMHKMKLNIAALINIFPNHDKYHGGYLNYIKAKLNIFLNQTNNDFALINIDQRESNSFQNLCNFSGNVIKLSLNGASTAMFFFKKGVLYKRETASPMKDNISTITSIYDFNLIVNTQSVNLLQMIIFCYAISSIVGIKFPLFLTALKNFKGLPHRQEIVLLHNNVLYINDSKATTPAASATALASYNNIYWIVGGIRKSGSLKICRSYFSKVKHIFIYGPDKNKFVKELKGKASFSCYDTLKSATIAAYKEVTTLIDKNFLTQGNYSQAVVLFSPVGASFDEFNNFEERGEFFKKTIKELVNVTL